MMVAERLVQERHATERLMGNVPPRPRRTHRQTTLLDHAALCASVRALWRKAYRLGQPVPVAELCLDLEALPAAELADLRAHVWARLAGVAVEAGAPA